MRGTLKTRDKGNTGTGVPRAKATPTALQENEGSRLGVHPHRPAADQREFMVSGKVSTLWSSKK